MTDDAIAPGIVGRSDELAAVRAFLSDGLARSGVLVLEGEAGIGKTTLWREGRAQAAREGCHVLSSAPGQTETGLAYSALRDILADEFDGVATHLPPPQRHALGVVLLRRDAGKHPPQEASIGAGLVAALRAIASPAQPLLVAIDDVQWLDAPSASALSFALRRLGDEPILWLLSVRRPVGEPLPLGLERPLPGDNVQRLPVGPLPADMLQHVVQTHLGDTFSRATLDRLFETSGGNPFFVLELARALRRRGGHPAAGAPLPVPTSLSILVRDRLAAMPAETEEPLLAIAALAAPTAAQVAGATAADAARRLTPAADAKIVEYRGDHLAFTHPLLAAAVYTNADPARRRSMHARLATMVPDVEERARHLALAAHGPSAETATALDDAAHHAAARGARSVAADLAELAAGLSEDAALRSDRLLRAAEWHREVGEVPRARALAEPLLGTLEAGAPRARLLLLLAQTEMSFETAERHLVEGLDAAGAHPALAAAMFYWMSVMALLTGRVGVAVERAGQALARATVAEDPGAEVAALSLTSLVRTLAGLPVADADLHRAIRIERTLANPVTVNRPGMVLALMLTRSDRADEARSLYTAMLTEAAEAGLEEPISEVCLFRSLLEWRAGAWDRAAEFAERGHLITRSLGIPQREGTFLYLKALLAASAGREDEARSVAAAAIARAEATHDAIWEIESRTVLGILELSVGNPRAARDELGPLPARLRAMGYGDPGHFSSVPALVEAAAATGEIDAEIEALVAWFHHQAVTLNQPTAIAQAARCRGILAAAADNLDEALQAFGEALVVHQRLPGPFETGRTLLAQGAVQRHMRSRRAARESLQAAMTAFSEAGAPLWMSRARAELESVSGRAPAGSDLTPAQRRVAELVAQGMTNREVATALSLTVSTVEATLTRVYARLGVRSRTELGRRMG